MSNGLIILRKFSLAAACAMQKSNTFVGGFAFNKDITIEQMICRQWFSQKCNYDSHCISHKAKLSELGVKAIIQLTCNIIKI